MNLLIEALDRVCSQGVSHVHRLRTSDRIPSTAAQDGKRKSNRFFVTVSLRRQVKPLDPSEYAVVIGAL